MSSTSSVNSLLSSTSSANSAIDISSILAASTGSSSSGIDVTSAVAAAIYADRASERAWQADQTTLTSQTTALTAIQTATQAIATDMESLNTFTGPFSARAVTSSNSAYLTATAVAGTVAGSHSVVVNNLATTGSWYSDLEASSTTALPPSALTITTTSGQAATITIGAGVNTLAELATAISDATSTTSYGSSLTNVATSTSLTAGSVTTIQDTGTGKTFTYTAASGDTVATLNAAIATAVTAGTLSANVKGAVSGGQEVISEGSAGAGITVSTNETALGTMSATSLGLTATVVSDSTGSRLAIISNTAGAAGGFSITSQNYTGTSWTSPDIPTGSTLGANSLTLKSAAGTVTVNTTSGETYAQLATAINSAAIVTSYTGAKTGLTASSFLTEGSVTTIQDTSTGKTFTYTAASGDTVDTLNSAIAAAVTDGTLSANVAGAVTGGKEIISEGLSDKGVTVTTNDAVLGAMSATAGASTPLGLVASAGSDANGTNLMITGSSAFTINEPAFGFTQATVAADASLTVDGVPHQSASNIVTGAISGVTLDLLGATAGSPITLTVASDTTQLSTAINQFVTDYNTALGLVNKQFSMDSTTGAQGVLASDPTLRSLQNALEQAVSYVNTPATGTTTVSTLTDLGITVGNDGILTVDSSALSAALTNNASDVQSFFEGTSLNGFSNSMYSALNTYTNAANGAFKVDLSNISTENTDLTTQINTFESTYIAAQTTLLTAEYSAAEVALQQLPQQMQELNSELGFNTQSS
jgi:flagellar hook-associated protein 2